MLSILGGIARDLECRGFSDYAPPVTHDWCDHCGERTEWLAVVDREARELRWYCQRCGRFQRRTKL